MNKSDKLHANSCRLHMEDFNVRQFQISIVLDNDPYDQEKRDSCLNQSCSFLAGDVWHKAVRENLAEVS